MLPADTANLRYTSDELEAVHDAHARLVVTGWPQFAHFNLHRLHRGDALSRCDDRRNLFTLKRMTAPEFHYSGGGCPLSEPQLPPRRELDIGKRGNSDVVSSLIVRGVLHSFQCFCLY